MAKKDPNFPMQGKGGGMGGKYARKAENLSAKELKAAGAAKAAKKRTVSISDTKRVTEGANKGKTVGPGGKPLTGSVRLENGAMAVYKDGKRVTKAPAKAAPATRSRSASSSSSSSSARKANPNANVKVGTIRKGAAGNKYNKWDGKKWVPVAAARTGSGAGQSASVASKRVPSKAAVSGTVSSAIAQGKRGGKGSGNGTAPGTKEAMGGYVRGNPYAQQAAVTARRTGRQPMPGSVIAQTKNKRAQDQRNQGRDAAAIAGLTIGAAAAGAGLAARGGTAAAAAARKAIEAGGRKAIGAAPPRAIPGGRPAAARVTIERMGQGTRGTGARPQSATPTPRKAITARPRPETIAERVQRGEITRTSPIGNPKLDGTKNTGPKTLAQVRSERARKAAATRKANAAKKK